MFFRLLVQSVDDMEEHVVGQHVAPYLGASLCVHRHTAVAELMQHVEAVNDEGKTQLRH